MNNHLNIRYLVGVVLFLHCMGSVFGQYALPRTPISEKQKLSTEIPTIELPRYSKEDIIKAQNFASERGMTPIIGVGYPMDLDMQRHGTWEELRDGSRVWRLRIIASGAPGIKLICDQFYMPEASSLYFYPPDKAGIYGAYTSLNHLEGEGFVTGFLKGEEIIIEYNEPPSLVKGREEPQFRVTDVAYNDIDFNTNEFGDDCHNNVNCNPWSGGWCNEIRSAIKLEMIVEDVDGEINGIPGQLFLASCSGGLVNNEREDFDPLILTASHCINMENQSDPDFPKVMPERWLVYYNWNSPVCVSTMGNDRMTTRGVDILEMTESILCNDPDMALIRIFDPMSITFGVPSTIWNYNVFFAGWNRNDRETFPSDNVVGIHHPAGDVKKISSGEITGEPGECFRVSPTDGSWENGSSGSPLFAEDHRLIGVLSSGRSWPEPNCDTRVKFSQLREAWNELDLDAHLGSSMTLNGIDPIGACQDDLTLFGFFWPGNDWNAQNQITIQAGNTIVASPTPQFESLITDSPGGLGLTNNSDYVFRAGNSVSLRAGFHAESGNRFRAEIGACQGFEGCGFNYQERIASGNPEIKVEQVVQTLVEEEVDFVIFPNPAHSILNIKGQGITHIEVFSLFEKEIPVKILETTEDQYVISVQSLRPGSYFVKIYSEEQIHVAKWMKL